MAKKHLVALTKLKGTPDTTETLFGILDESQKVERVTHGISTEYHLGPTADNLRELAEKFSPIPLPLGLSFEPPVDRLYSQHEIYAVERLSDSRIREWDEIYPINNR